MMLLPILLIYFLFGYGGTLVSSEKIESKIPIPKCKTAQTEAKITKPKPETEKCKPIESPRIVCYVRSKQIGGKTGFKMEDIPKDMCTHIIYSFVGISKHLTTIEALNPKVEIKMDGIKNFTALRKTHPNSKFILGVGGWAEGGSKFSHMVSSNTSRACFVKDAIEFLKKYNFDGLDLVWEYPGCKERGGNDKDKEGLVNLVQDLKDGFKKACKDWELTAAVPICEDIVKVGYDVRKLCELLDAVNVISFDLRRCRAGIADVHAPLVKRPFDEGKLEKLNVKDGLELWEKSGCPSNKLVVGIPFFGVTYTLAGNDTKPGAKACPANCSEYKSYSEICDMVKKKNWTKEFDENTTSTYAYKWKQWVGYDDPTSIGYKVNWLMEMGYLGAMVWSLDMDDHSGLCGSKYPLLKEIFKLLCNYHVPPPRCDSNKVTNDVKTLIKSRRYRYILK